jgi:hypothetical protein
LEVDEQTGEKIREQIYNEAYGLKGERRVRYTARVNLKSDPKSAIAGDDTVNCMPFGSGKNNIYMFNPNSVLFTVERINGDNIKRTIAESVLTKDLEIDKLVSEVIEELSKGEDMEGKDITKILTEKVLEQQPAIVACDNVEVNPNYTHEKKAIEEIYREFFRIYLQEYGERYGIQTDKVIIGTGYSDALDSLPTVDNRYLPKAPVGYSDNLGAECFELDLVNTEEKLDVIQVKKGVLPEKAENLKLPKGVRELTYEDALAVAYLEGRGYGDNPSLIQHLHNMENALIAKDINNSAKGRPNMSFGYESEGKLRGYMVAYEGKIDDFEEYDLGDYHDLIGDNREGRCLYIMDLTVKEPGSVGGARAGSAIINGFLARYKEEYLGKENYLPIYLQAREQTSFKLIERKLDEISEELGISFARIDFDEYGQGSDIMHPMIIVPKQKSEENG